MTNFITDKEILEKLQNVTVVLDNITCKGMQNLLSLGGSIGILNEIMQELSFRMDKENSEN